MEQIAIIGGARSNECTNQLSEQLGILIAENGYSLVCGGLSGTMSSACRGFKSIKSQGVTIGILPGSDPTKANEWVDIIIPTGMDVARNSLVVASAKVVIAIGGGAGTLSEISLASQLGRPIILFHDSGGWCDRLKDYDFLDDRKSTRLYHAYSLQELEKYLAELMDKPVNAGAINSGHLQR